MKKLTIIALAIIALTTISCSSKNPGTTYNKETADSTKFIELEANNQVYHNQFYNLSLSIVQNLITKDPRYKAMLSKEDIDFYMEDGKPTLMDTQNMILLAMQKLPYFEDTEAETDEWADLLYLAIGTQYQGNYFENNQEAIQYAKQYEAHTHILTKGNAYHLEDQL